MRDTLRLFDPTEFGKLTRRDVAGFDRAVPAICYRGADLKSPFPIGGVATGYLELRGDGKLGLASLYNNYVPPMQAAGAALLTLISADGKETPLDADHADITILAHFPVCNVRYAVKNDGPVVWLRVWTVMLPGDAEASNTPGAVFEIATEKPFHGTIRVEIALAHNVELVTKPIDLPVELNGSGRKYFKRDDYRASFVLAWTDGLAGTGESADDVVHLRLRGSINSPRRAVFTWH